MKKLLNHVKRPLKVRFEVKRNLEVKKSMGSCYLGLIHYPVYNKYHKIITTAVTNFDIHDIARSAKTYGIKGYFVVHPVHEQVEMVRKLVNHWQTGFGSTFNPDRKQALDNVDVVANLDEAIKVIENEEGKKPKCIFTAAASDGKVWSFNEMKKEMAKDDNPYLLIFGTGHGIAKQFFSKADYVLEPIYGPTEYNHLCVRSAVSIILDRLYGIRG